MAIAACMLTLFCGGTPQQHPHRVWQRGGQAQVVERRLVDLVPKWTIPSWICIHRHEAAWDDAGDPYWGGLQMDRGFMRAYGGDMILKYKGRLADGWSPKDQIVVAERARKLRGWEPWPNTSRACGLRY